jgi:hypothetical protein
MNGLFQQNLYASLTLLPPLHVTKLRNLAKHPRELSCSDKEFLVEFRARESETR